MDKKILLGIMILAFSRNIFAFEIPLQAEEFNLVSGWKISDYGYFPSQPNYWSLTKIIGDETDLKAIAYKDIEVPETKQYYVWVRYESCYGFGSVFKIVIEQNGVKQEAIFGRKEDKKYFPFGRGYTVQLPWTWHNTDYVYQGEIFNLKKGKARVYIIKDKNEKPPAKRVIDFVYITDDLNLRPGDDWAWKGEKIPPIISRFTLPLFIKVSVIDGEKPILLSCKYEWFLIGYYKGPRETYYFSKKGLLKKSPPLEERLKKGDIVDWQEVKIYPVMPPVLTFTLEGEGKVKIEVSVKNKKNIVKEIYVDSKKKEESLIVGIGQKRYEEGVLGDKKALTFEEFYKKQIDIVKNYKVRGRPAEKLFLLSRLGSFPYFDFELSLACGMNGEYYNCHPKIYSKNPEWEGFNTSIGFISLQNTHLNRECYEGNFERVEKIYKERAEKLKSELGREIPQYIKLIEESGPPSLKVLREWDKINEKFKKYMEENGIKGYDKLGEGTPEEAKNDPVLFYHSIKFREKLFTEVCRKATELIEKNFPQGTKTDSGSIDISTGGDCALFGGYEVFNLFKNRGVTAFSSEKSWGWGGMPDYIGPQTQSYEAALARSLSKYYNAPMGSYLISDGNRGYTPEFVELASYPLFANGFTYLRYYCFGYPAECSFIGYSEILKAIKRISYKIGEVEDYLLDGKVIKSDIALGYSETTNIWDLSIKPEVPDLPGNAIYPQERQNFFYILKHLYYPVDILSEEDIIDGYIDGYKVYILIGDHIQRKAAEKIADWVKNGGYLISVAGGGIYDEYNREIPIMKEIFGIEETKIEKVNHFMRPKLDLLFSEPLDKIKFDIDGVPSMDIFAYRESFKLKDGKAIGYYKNGEIAAVINNYGKGKSLIIGGLPGLSYLKGSFPLLPYGRGGFDLSTYIPTKFNDGVRKVIGYFLKEIEAPVVCSNYLVEPVIMESKTEKDIYYISLINFSGKEIRNLKVSLNLGNLKKVKGIFSDVKVRGNNILIPKIDKFEFLIVEKGGAK